MSESNGFESWGIVEIMGHKVYAGRLTEQVIAGAAMLRVDVPQVEDIAGYTKFFGSSSLYAITPTDEPTAKSAAGRLQERPVSLYLLPMLAATVQGPTRIEDDDPDEEDTSDYYPDFDEDDEDDLDDEEDEDFDEGMTETFPLDDDPDDDEDVLEDEGLSEADLKTLEPRTSTWAKALIAQPGFRVLDIETTGIEAGSEPVQIAVIDEQGKTLLNTLIKPSKPIPAQAARVHGISDDIVIAAPTLADVWGRLIEALGGDQSSLPKYKTPIVIYNRDFDTRVLRESGAAIGQVLPDLNWQCAMLEYAEFWGDWNDYHHSYRWQKLTSALEQQGISSNGQAHGALTDALNTLALVRKMAGLSPEA